MLKTRQLTISFHADLYDLVPQDHLLRRIAGVVDFSFVNDLLSDSYCRYYGRPAREPELMLKLLFLQFLYDLSDEQVVQDAQVNLAYKWFLGLNPEDTLPDPSVLSRFRTQRLSRSEQTVKGLLDGIVRQCVTKELIKSNRVLVDATHIEADTRCKRPLDVLRAAARKIVRAVRKQHPHLVGELRPYPETHDLSSAVAGDVLIRHLEDLVKDVKAAVPTVKGGLGDCLRKAERILADDRRLQTNGISSEEDLDARVGRKSKTHLFFGYKQHLGMADEDEIITGCHVTPGNADDGKQLPALVEQSKTTVPGIAELVGDAAYGSRANLAMLEESQITGYVALNPAVFSNQPDPRFAYNKDSDQWVCPAGHTSYRRSHFTKKRRGTTATGYIYFFDPKVCAVCPMREGCYSGQVLGKSISITASDPAQAAAKERQTNPLAQTIYKRRSAIEHKIAELKRFCGLARARYRSHMRVYLQAVMACIVANAKRMTKLIGPTPA